ATVRGVHVLGVVPRIRSLPATPGGGDPGPIAYPEAFRGVRSSLLSADGSDEPRAILVTSPDRARGKTTVALYTSIALASGGKKVTAVAADARQPRLDQWLGGGDGPGLPEVLSGSTPLE